MALSSDAPRHPGTPWSWQGLRDPRHPFGLRAAGCAGVPQLGATAIRRGELAACRRAWYGTLAALA